MQDATALDRLADMLPVAGDGAERAARRAAGRALIADLAPAPGVESLLAVQMAAAHLAALDCLARAAETSDAGRDRALTHAERLLSLCARQTDVLGRHRAREDRRNAARARAESARARAGPGDGKHDGAETVRPRRVSFDAKEWWAVRAHVLDPRIVLARFYAEADARDAGLEPDAIAAAGERAAREAASDPPTIAGRPYSLDRRGDRLYPLPDGRLARGAGIADEPFTGYFALLRRREGEAAARQAEEVAARNGRLPNNPWRDDYRPAAAEA